MNIMTMVAIRYVFNTNSEDAIAVFSNTVQCVHPTPLSAEIVLNDYCVSEDTYIDTRIVVLEPYRYDRDVVLMGECPKCGQVYYLE